MRARTILLPVLMALAGCKTAPTETPPPVRTASDDLRRYREESDYRLVQQLDEVIQRWLAPGDEQIKTGLEDVLARVALANEGSLLRLLATGDQRSRIVAAGALGFARERRHVAPLMAALESPTPQVVENALLSLWMIGSSDTPKEPLVRLLASQNPCIRSNAALVLGAVLRPGESEGVLQPLIFTLQDTDDVARANAAGALGRIRDPEATPHLVKALQDRYPLIRLRAAVALGVIRDRRAVPALIEALGDPDEKVRSASHKALRAITLQDLPRERAAWEAWAARQGGPAAPLERLSPERP